MPQRARGAMLTNPGIEKLRDLPRFDIVITITFVDITITIRRFAFDTLISDVEADVRWRCCR